MSHSNSEQSPAFRRGESSIDGRMNGIFIQELSLGGRREYGGRFG